MISPTEALALARNDLAVITERLPRALKAIHAAQPGIRSVPTDSPSSNHGGDPTPQAAHTRGTDPAVRALADLTDAIIGARQRADKALRSVWPETGLATPRVGDMEGQIRFLGVYVEALSNLVAVAPHELGHAGREWVAVIPEWTRRAATICTVWTARPTTAGAHLGDPGCQWMAHHKGKYEVARYYVTATGPARKDGSQPATVGKTDGIRHWRVGQNVYRHVRSSGYLPSKETIRRWDQGLKARRTIDPTKKGTAA